MGHLDLRKVTEVEEHCLFIGPQRLTVRANLKVSGYDLAIGYDPKLNSTKLPSLSRAALNAVRSKCDSNDKQQILRLRRRMTTRKATANTTQQQQQQPCGRC
jgi:hypothetical protein